jgi:hypoxanthine phosphoribosyltransferase
MPVYPQRARLRSLLSAEDVETRVRTMGHEISQALTGLHPHFVCILKGSLPFYGSLIRAIDVPMTCDYVAVTSYSGTQTTGEVQFRADLSEDIRGRHVVLVEDIVDTGLTLDRLTREFLTRGPASLHVATLLDKPSRRKTPVRIDWRGFEIEDLFVVGYGLDYEQYFRNLPEISVLENPADLHAE